MYIHQTQEFLKIARVPKCTEQWDTGGRVHMYRLAYNLIWWNSQFSTPSWGLGIRGQLVFLERPSAINGSLTWSGAQVPCMLCTVPPQLGNAAPLPVAAAPLSHCSQDSRSLPGTHSPLPCFQVSSGQNLPCSSVSLPNHHRSYLGHGGF